MRVAVIGAGSMGGMHARLLARLESVDEVLVVDPDTARAAAVLADTGGRHVTREEALAAADAVVIATPATHHAADVEAAVAAGVPALCEKPLTEDLSTALALVERVERAGAHVEMGFQRRHEASFVEARRRIESGATGRIQLLRLTALDPRVPERAADAWPMRDAAPVFLHSSVHDFDAARWLSGSEVVEVTAIGTRREGVRADDPRSIEAASVTLLMANGAIATLEASWLHPSGYDVRVELVTEHAHLTLGLSGGTPAEHLDWTDAPRASAWSGYLERFADAYRAELVAFLAAARGERAPASGARDGLEALRIAVAATRSHVERRVVAMTELA